MISFKQFFKPTKSLDKIAKKHDVDKKYLEQQLKKGIDVESEHTSHNEIATTIALHHLDEKPDYYELLKKVENA